MVSKTTTKSQNENDLWNLAKSTSWLNVTKLRQLVEITIDLNKKYNNEDSYVNEFIKVFDQYRNESPQDHQQHQFMIAMLEDVSHGRMFENELILALHFVSALCLYVNPFVTQEIHSKSLHILQNDLAFYKLELERRNKYGQTLVNRVRNGVREFLLLRMFNWLNYTTVHFLISLFGSRIGPLLFSKFVSEEQMQKLLKIQNSKTNVRGYSGFVFGTILGAMVAAVPLRISHQTQRHLINRKNSLESEIVQSSECTTSQSFWMMIGAFMGLLMNYGARYGAHTAVLYFLSSQLPIQLLAKHPMGRDPQMAKMILKTAVRMYQSFASSLLYPKIGAAPASDTKSSNSNLPDFSMVASMMNLGRESILSQIPLYNQSTIARYIVDHYIVPTSKQSSSSTDQKKGYLSKVTNTLSNGYKWSQNQAARIYPSENSSWHTTSAGLALWFSSRYANRDLKKEQQLFSELHAFMRSTEQHLISNNTYSIPSRL
jgi:hypothetical protein